MQLSVALCRMPPVFFEKDPINAEIALRTVKSADDLARIVLETNSPTLAARLAGAYLFLKDTAKANHIINAARAADMIVEPRNPFVKTAPILSGTARLISPYARRIEALYNTSREHVLEVFKDLPQKPVADPDSYLGHVEAVYEHDAYNSLSIEGYQVTPELIQKIRDGDWNSLRPLSSLRLIKEPVSLQNPPVSTGSGARSKRGNPDPRLRDSANKNSPMCD